MPGCRSPGQLHRLHRVACGASTRSFVRLDFAAKLTRDAGCVLATATYVGSCATLEKWRETKCHKLYPLTAKTERQRTTCFIRVLACSSAGTDRLPVPTRTAQPTRPPATPPLATLSPASRFAWPLPPRQLEPQYLCYMARSDASMRVNCAKKELRCCLWIQRSFVRELEPEAYL